MFSRFLKKSMILFIFSEILSDSDDGDVDDGEGEENHEEVVGDKVEALEDQVFHKLHTVDSIKELKKVNKNLNHLEGFLGSFGK